MENQNYVYNIPKTSDVEMSNELNEIASALSKAQAELESVAKEEEGYGYNYASLASTIKVAKPVLAKNNLSFTQLLGNANKDLIEITTILLHSSGQYIKSKLILPSIEMKGCNEVQSAGASQSYGRRYALQAILGMSSEDVDASSEGSKKSAYPAPKNPTTTQSSFRRKKVKKEVESKEHDI
jgi:hypothetical protein